MSHFNDRFLGLPAPAKFPENAVLEDLGDGLLMRRASEEDTEAVSAFNRVAQADPPDFEPIDHIATWTRELMAGGHPSMRARDFVIVEDTREQRIASTACLLSHRFAFDGIEFPAGQPELVATHPEYRRRGLVARQFGLIHEWSAERGQRLLLIDGIPNYYRQFGYEMAIETYAARAAYPVQLRGQGLFIWAFPRADAESAPDLTIRPATEGDVPFLMALYDRACRHQGLVCLRDEEAWRFDLTKRHPGSFCRRDLRIVDAADGRPLAAFALYPILIAGSLPVSFYEVAEGVSWHAVNATVLRELHAIGEAHAAEANDGTSFAAALFLLGTGHPFYRTVPASASDEQRPYAYYARVADLPGFLHHMAPALDARLAATPHAHYTGRIDISFYTNGIRLHLEDGRLLKVDTWCPSTDEPAHLSFPGLTFLQALFGHRSVTELAASFPDCLLSNETATGVVDALFPRKPVHLWLTG